MSKRMEEETYSESDSSLLLNSWTRSLCVSDAFLATRSANCAAAVDNQGTS